MEKNSQTSSPKAVVMSRSLSAGQKAFYQTIYEQHKATYRFLLRGGVSGEQASDILHDVYYRIIRQNEPEKLEDSPKAYLIKIAINLLRDRSRRAKTSAVMHDSGMGGSESELLAVELSSEKQAQLTEQLELIKQAILELPNTQRQIFIMHRFDNMSYQAISEEIGIPLRTVQELEF